MSTISLLGCGYLGFPLAVQLLQNGHCIKGSTTREEKFDQLKSAGIIPYLIKLGKDIPVDFFQADILVLTLPYKKSFSDPRIYRKQIETIATILKDSNIQHIIFTSSSSIYPKDGKEYSPNDIISLPNGRAKILLECENILRSIENISVIIIRLGGLYGAGRTIKKTNKTRRLISHKESLELITNAINNIGHNQCVNGFSIIKTQN